MGPERKVERGRAEGKDQKRMTASANHGPGPALDLMLAAWIERDPERLGGVPVFSRHARGRAKACSTICAPETRWRCSSMISPG